MRALLALALALAACELPDPKLVFAVSDDPAQSCGSRNCADIQIPCDAVVSLRIFDPQTPLGATTPIVSICEDLPQNRNKDLCAVASIDLSDKPIKLPRETLEVQLVIWPRHEVETDGELDCAKHEVVFDAVYGFPISQSPTPAIGGHTYYHPGDEEIRVTLGCTNLDSVSSCAISTDVEVSATVESVENLGVLVTPFDASDLTVSVGEPKASGADTVHELNPMETRNLPLAIETFNAVWRSLVDLDFTDIACIEVDENTAQATNTLSCEDDNVPTTQAMLRLRGVYIPKATLDQILAALPLAQFPTDGMTVGIIVDKDFNPDAGHVVLQSGPGAGTTRYLNAARTGFTGSATSASGMFVSLDAEFGTKFSASGSSEEVGGRVREKVTVVVIQAP